MTSWWQHLQQDWASDLDLSGGRARAAWWAWLVLAAGALALLVAVDHADNLRAEQADAAEQVKRLSRADRQMRLQRALIARATSPDTAASMPTSGAHSDQVKLATAPALQGPVVQAATRMVRQLAYPWQAHLGQLDAHARQAQVVMTQLAVNLESATQLTAGSASALSPQWRLQAAALDDASALAWTRLLPQGTLVSREPLKTPFNTRAGTYTLQVSANMQPALRAAVLPTPGAAP